MNYVIYTDLDGTLLDHDSYSFQAALPAIEQAQLAGIPIIPVTSKTRSEIEELRKAIPLETPFVVENGAAIFIPKTDPLSTALKSELIEIGNYWVKRFSMTRKQWQAIITELSVGMEDSFRPFSAMSTTDIADLTGLSVSDAQKANEREFSDPLHWYGGDDQFQSLKSRCAQQGIEVVKGGRFVHLIQGADKGIAVQSLHEFYKQFFNNPSLKSIVLGDGGNDVAMLEKADYPVCIRSKTHEYPTVKKTNVIYTDAYGPEGWSQAIKAILNQ